MTQFRGTQFQPNVPLTNQTALVSSVTSYLWNRSKTASKGRPYQPVDGGPPKQVGTKDHSLTKEDIKDLLIKQDGKCALTGTQLFLATATIYAKAKTYLRNEQITSTEYNTRPSIDRIDNKKGYERSNIQITTISANNGKNGTTFTDRQSMNSTVDYKKYIIDKFIQTQDTSSLKQMWEIL